MLHSCDITTHLRLCSLTFRWREGRKYSRNGHYTHFYSLFMDNISAIPGPYPHETKTSTILNVLTFSTCELRSYYFLLKMAPRQIKRLSDKYSYVGIFLDPTGQHLGFFLVMFF